jgi:hypothetical protein
MELRAEWIQQYCGVRGLEGGGDTCTEEVLFGSVSAGIEKERVITDDIASMN